MCQGFHFFPFGWPFWKKRSQKQRGRLKTRSGTLVTDFAANIKSTKRRSTGVPLLLATEKTILPEVELPSSPRDRRKLIEDTRGWRVYPLSTSSEYELLDIGV
jgi:hypothetical protein